MLKGNSKRQAGPSIKGYLYQFWHTLYNWLDLEQDEILYIECGEDIDISSKNKNEATTIQVKNIKKNISLRDSDVIDAINNYWDLKKENPSSNISFVFLTTAQSTIEKGDPFNGNAGLSQWAIAKRDLDAVKLLKEFLVKEGNLDSEILTFLQESKSEKICSDLIQPISWLTERSNFSELKEAVKKKLLFHGERFGIEPAISTGVSDRLVLHIAEIATLKKAGERKLKKVDFLKIFEDETTERVPRREARELYQDRKPALVSLPLSLLFDDDIENISIGIDDESVDSVPDLHSDILYRKELINNILKDLNKTGLLVITGSSGMGKSTLSKLISIKLNNLDSWFWVSFSGKEASQVEGNIKEVYKQIEQTREKVNLIFDDIDLANANYKRISSILSAVIYTILERNGYLLITTKKALPSNLVNNFSITKFEAPPFDDSDIEQFLINKGCPENRASELCKYLELQTSGHPQLVHARINTLQRDGWKVGKLEDLLSKTDDIKERQEETRKLLVNELDDQQRLLLYTLSIVGGSFSRDQAVNLGSKLKEIDFPGEVFDSLVGPWIEKEKNNLFKVSPLLDRSGEEVWSAKRVNRVRDQIVESIFETGTLTMVDASKVLLHSMISGNKDHFLRMVFGLLTNIPEKSWDLAATHISWFAYAKNISQTFPDDPGIQFIFRKLQFKIANATDPERANEVVQKWKDETPITTDLKDIVNRVFVITNYLIYPNVKIDCREVVDLIEELESILSRLETFEDDEADQILEAINSISKDDPAESTVAYLSKMIAFKIETVDQLQDLIDGLSQKTKHVRSEFLSGFKESFLGTKTIASKAWLNESEKEKPDWDKCIKVYRKAIDFAKNNASKTLEVSFTKALATVYDEYLADSETAKNLIDKLLETYQNDIVLRDKKAVILFNNEEYSKAAQIWDNILPNLEDLVGEHDTDPLFAYRRAAISHAYLEHWKDSKKYFHKALEIAERKNIDNYTSGILADLGYAHFQLGNHRKALRCLLKSVKLMRSLPDKEEDLDTFTLYRMVGHVVSWIKHSLVDQGKVSTSLTEPLPGMCSNFNRDEELRDLPYLPDVFLWYMLYAIESDIDVDFGIREEFYSLDDWENYPSLLPMVYNQELERALKNEEIDEIYELVEKVEKSFVANAKLRVGGHNVWEKGDINEIVKGEDLTYKSVAPYIIFSALVICHSLGISPIKKVKEWEEASNNEHISTLFSEVGNLLQLSSGEAFQLFRKDGTEEYQKVILALSLILKRSIKPEILFIVSVYIFQYAKKGFITESYSDQLSDLITEKWLKASENRALLNMPNITVPKIREACNSEAYGLKRIADILLAAKDAVSVNLPANIVKELRETKSSDI